MPHNIILQPRPTQRASPIILPAITGPAAKGDPAQSLLQGLVAYWPLDEALVQLQES